MVVHVRGHLPVLPPSLLISLLSCDRSIFLSLSPSHSFAACSLRLPNTDTLSVSPLVKHPLSEWPWESHFPLYHSRSYL